MVKLKYLLENVRAEIIKTHLRVNGVDKGISGFYKRSELLEKYGEYDAEIVEYEKDYGDGAVVKRSFLAIDVPRGE